jgi:hypothetical protein
VAIGTKLTTGVEAAVTVAIANSIGITPCLVPDFSVD